MKIKKYNHDSGFAVIELVLLLLGVVIIGTVGYFVFNHSKQKTSPNGLSSASIKSSAAPSSTSLVAVPDSYSGWNTYTDPAKSFTVSYPQNWTVQTEASTSNSLESSIPILHPPYLNTAELNSGAGIYINATKNSLNSEFEAIVYGSGSSYSPTQITINGYQGLYHQVVQTAAETGTISDTKDYYAVAHDGVTVLFSWTEQQGSYENVSGFNLTTYNATFRSVVESIKFTN